MEEEAPIIKMVLVILRHAIEGDASDIHIEPGRDKLTIRFRLNGVLHSSLFLPLKVHPSIIARIKILSGLKIDENRGPQDGRFSVRINNSDIDFRVSAFAEEAIKEFAALKKQAGTAFQKVEVDRITCPYCKESVPSNKESCQNCGKMLPICQICNGSINSDAELVTCPHCVSNYHVNHFKEWYVENKNCPVCLGAIELNLFS